MTRFPSIPPSTLATVEVGLATTQVLVTVSFLVSAPLPVSEGTAFALTAFALPVALGLAALVASLRRGRTIPSIAIGALGAGTVGGVFLVLALTIAVHPFAFLLGFYTIVAATVLALAVVGRAIVARHRDRTRGSVHRSAPEER